MKRLDTARVVEVSEYFTVFIQEQKKTCSFVPAEVGCYNVINSSECHFSL